MMDGYGTPKLANEYSGACGSHGHGLPVETMNGECAVTMG